MTRETVEAKAERYLISARLLVVHVNGDQVAAYCRGQDAVYRLGHTPGRGWWCSCPSRRTCAHLEALMLVVVRRRDRQDS